MWGGIIPWAATWYSTVDPADGTDYGARATFRRDEDGTLHLVDLELLEPPHATLETRLVPGSNPPRYEPL